jgi:hypothetical protein
LDGAGLLLNAFFHYCFIVLRVVPVVAVFKGSEKSAQSIDCQFKQAMSDALASL